MKNVKDDKQLIEREEKLQKKLEQLQQMEREIREKEKAVKETLYKVLKNSIEYRTAHLDPTDMAGLQELLNKKKQIQRLA